MRTVGAKFTITLTIVLTILIVIFGGLTIAINIRESDRKISALLDSVSEMAQESLTPHLWNFDKENLQETVSAFMMNPSILHITVTADGDTNVQGKKTGYANRRLQDFLAESDYIATTVPLTYEGNTIGSAHFVLTTELYSKELRSYIIRLVSLLCILLLSIFLTTRLLTLIFIQKPLTQLKRSANALADGNLATPIIIKGNNEFAELANDFDIMRTSIIKLISAMKKSGLQLINTSEEISKTANIQEETTQEFRDLVHHIVSSSEGISATSQQLMTTMHDANEIAINTTTLADSGQHALNDMRNNMKQLLDNSNIISSDLTKISEKTKHIDTIITTLIKIADRTNLLSLNANIEAQKAGEHGMGFRIVAKEINNLAEQTATNTQQIKEFVEEMQLAITTGVTSMETFTKNVLTTATEVRSVGQQMSDILDHIQTLAPQFNEVNDGVQFQTTEALEINNALQTLREMTDQTMNNLSKFFHALNQLKNANEKLQQAVYMEHTNTNE